MSTKISVKRAIFTLLEIILVTGVVLFFVNYQVISREGSKTNEQPNVANYTQIVEEQQLADGSKLLYKSSVDDEYEHIIVIASEKEESVICSKPYCAPPVVSPDGNKIAYIDNLTWEELGDVYLYDLEKRKSELIINQDKDIKDQYTPKVLCWLDNNRLLAIIGFAYGTVSVGGELYLYDVEQGKLSLALEPGEQEEIRDIKVGKDEVTVEYAKFDEEWIKSTAEIKTFKMPEFLNLIGQNKD